MKRFLFRLLYFISLLMRSGNYKLSRYLSYSIAEMSNAERDCLNLGFKGGKIVFQNTGTTISYNQMRKFWGEPLISLANDKQFQLNTDDEQHLLIAVEDLKFKVSEPSSLFIIREMIREQLYDFSIDSDLVVCDVGMNTGIASLYLARYPNVKKIYAFEPFKETFDLAQENFALNTIGSKIISFNYGLGKENGTIQVPFYGAGCATASTTDFFIKESPPPGDTTMTVEIKDITEMLDKIKAENPAHRVLLKLDCEGAEYDIIARLNSSDRLKEISVILLEWHFKGKASLINTLTDNNFISFAPVNYQLDNLQWGMVYAFNQKQPAK